jgi:cellulose biosynthesis protein BcsQ
MAVHLAHQGVDVVMLDTDGQATSARFVERRDEADMLPPVRCVQRTGEVATTLRDLARRYQIVVVDAGGRDSREMRSAMAVANLLLVPTKASQADLETFPKVNELITHAERVRCAFDGREAPSAGEPGTGRGGTVTSAVVSRFGSPFVAGTSA